MTLVTSPPRFCRKGQNWFLNDVSDVHNDLPVGCYTVRHAQNIGFFLEEADSFTLPGKRYGINDDFAKRVLNTYKQRNKATGVLLCGEKGTGKSLQARTISVFAAELGIPTVLVNAAWHGDQFNMFLQNLKQPVVLIFDEFEKVYEDRSNQEAVLTLLDGVVPNNCLFLFTANDKYKIDTNLRNRPGRIFYAIDYAGLHSSTIKAYCDDHLTVTTKMTSVVKVATSFKSFSMDMLQALVEESNRYPEESVIEALDVLNIKPEFDSVHTYKVAATHDTWGITELDTEEWKGNPTISMFNIVCYVDKRPESERNASKKKDKPSEYEYIRLSPEFITDHDVQKGEFTYKKEGWTIQINRVVEFCKKTSEFYA